MDQSKSNSKSTSEEGRKGAHQISVPARSFTLEFWVGLFAIAAVAAGGYLAVGLGELRILGDDSYDVVAEFDNISGLQHGASVEIAGVPIGSVSAINLKDPEASVTLRIHKDVKLHDDDIASIRTKGIIGDRYVKISRGSSDVFIAAGAKLTETESVVDIEDIIGKIVHSLSGGDKDKGE